jgi:hypothetical protein
MDGNNAMYPTTSGSNLSYRSRMSLALSPAIHGKEHGYCVTCQADCRDKVLLVLYYVVCNRHACHVMGSAIPRVRNADSMATNCRFHVIIIRQIEGWKGVHFIRNHGPSHRPSHQGHNTRDMKNGFLYSDLITISNANLNFYRQRRNLYPCNHSPTTSIMQQDIYQTITSEYSCYRDDICKRPWRLWMHSNQVNSADIETLRPFHRWESEVQ